MFRYIGLNEGDCMPIRSYYGLPECLFYRGVKVHFSENLAVLDCSGKGCRTLEALNPGMSWYDFLSVWYKCMTVPIKDSEGQRQYSVHISRIDLACDALDEKALAVPRLQNYVQHKKFLCKSNYHSCIMGNYEQAIYFGSPKSDRRLRIYDKAMEQGLDGAAWVRFEFQLRNDNALSFVMNLFETCKGNFAKCYYGMMRDYLKFITEPNNDTNSARKKLCPWWRKFLEDVAAIPQLYLPAEKYDISNLANFIKHECGSSIRTFLTANGGDVGELLDMVMESKLNKRQEQLLQDLGYDPEERASANSAEILRRIGEL